MSIELDLTKTLTDLGMSFIERAVARELLAQLMVGKAIGSMDLDVPTLASEWSVGEREVWSVIHRLVDVDFWEVSSGCSGEVLVCQALAGSAKAIGKARKTARMRSLKKDASEDRASKLTLADANIANRSLFAEVAEVIPLADRFEILKRPYGGWLPSSAYAASGVVFKPDAAMINKLRTKHPDLDIDLAFALMYEDLRECPRDRPSMESFSYWIPNWINKNSERLVSQAVSEAKVNQFDALLDDYLS